MHAEIVPPDQGMLTRCRANVIGSVVNQVNYRSSTVYHRSKYAYSSYYNRPLESTDADAPVAPPAKPARREEKSGQ